MDSKLRDLERRAAALNTHEAWEALDSAQIRAGAQTGPRCEYDDPRCSLLARHLVTQKHIDLWRNEYFMCHMHLPYILDYITRNHDWAAIKDLTLICH